MPERRKDRRAQLIELGIRLFTERAYGEVSIDDIADAAGVAKGLLYHYFGGKKSFYVAALQVAADRMLDAVTVDPSLPGPVRVAQGLAAYLDFVEQRADAFVALTSGGLGQDPEVAAVLESTRERLAAQILGALGLTPPWRPVWRSAVRGWLGASEAASLDHLRHRDVPREALIGILVATLRTALDTAAALDPNR
jgi:AcrR family transcriptional regulator